ncbi:hypothetical protein FRC02_003782 [Tulasnella sp. 418]|nr:hypothetical protein FRC02_003782 [Tulasnella sp. 418]
MASATAQNKQFFNLRTVFSYIITSNAWKAQPDISRSTLSHLALAIAAVHASAITDDVWSYPTASHRDLLNKLVRERFSVIDKSKMILENVVLALSMIDTISVPAPGIMDWSHLRYLFRITVPLFSELHGSIQNPIPFPTFPHSIIRTAAKYPNDRVLQRQVIQVLALCPNGDWLSPFNEQHAEALLKIIGILLSPETGTNPNANPDDSLMIRLLDKMADVLDDEQLLRALEEEKAIYPHLQSILRILRGNYFLGNATLVRKILLFRIQRIQQSTKPQELLSLQYSIAIHALERPVWKFHIPIFFNKLFEDDEELCWPSYFISAEIVPVDAQAKEGTQSVPPLRYIDPKGLNSILLRSYIPGSNANLWYGEAVMLLLKKTSRDHANGRLPPTWNDSIFFTYGLIGVMIKFYRQFKQQKHTGTDLESLKDYFSRALDKLRPIEGGKEGGSQPQPDIVNMRAARHKELQNFLRDFDVSDMNEPLVTGGEGHIKT